jgi:SNF2 family DNA or RNA helicase
MKVRIEKVGDRIHAKSSYTANPVDFDRVKRRLKEDLDGRWSPKSKAWTYPLDLEQCRRFRDVFGDDLIIEPELWEWAKRERAKETDLTALVNVTDINVMEAVDLPRVRESMHTMWRAMQQRPYQPVAALYMARARRCLNADQPGLGKTIETLAALIEAGVADSGMGRVLILAPKTSCSVVWEPEILRWVAPDMHVTVTNMSGLGPAARDKAWAEFMRASQEDDDFLHFCIVNAEQVGIRKFTECPAGICDGDEDWCPEFGQHVNKSEKRRPHLHSIAWDAIIADETHKWLINSRGKNASQVGYGFTKLRLVSDDSPMYALSGTPLKGKKWNLFGTLNWLWPKTYSSKWRWIGSYFEVVKETIIVRGGREQETTTVTGRWKDERAMDAFYRHLNMVMIRRTKDELRRINPAWMPPEKRYHDVWVPMDGSQKSHYKSMEKDARVRLQSNTLTANGILAELTRLKQFAGTDGDVQMVPHRRRNPMTGEMEVIEEAEFVPCMPSNKFNWLLQFLEERGIEQATAKGQPGDLSEDVRKVVVASQFTRNINAWAAELIGKGIQVHVLTGETTDRERKRLVKSFQESNDVRVFVINTTAGGVSITLDSADDIVLMDETWTPDEMEQVEDRVHRASNVKHQVDVWYVRSKETVEEGIAAVNAIKAESNHVVLDAQRGLQFAVARWGVKPVQDGEEA